MLSAAVQAPQPPHDPTLAVLRARARRRGPPTAVRSATGRPSVWKEEDAKDAVVSKVEASHRDLPAMLAVSMTLDDNPEIREEDYAATYMAVQNL